MQTRAYRRLIGAIAILVLGWLAVAEAPRYQKITGALVVLMAGAGLARLGRPVMPGGSESADLPRRRADFPQPAAGRPTA